MSARRGDTHARTSSSGRPTGWTQRGITIRVERPAELMQPMLQRGLIPPSTARLGLGLSPPTAPLRSTVTNSGTNLRNDAAGWCHKPGPQNAQLKAHTG